MAVTPPTSWVGRMVERETSDDAAVVGAVRTSNEPGR